MLQKLFFIKMCAVYVFKKELKIKPGRVNVSCVFCPLRLLLRILRQQQSSFVLQRSENTLQRADEALQLLNPKETTQQALTEVRTPTAFVNASCVRA